MSTIMPTIMSTIISSKLRLISCAVWCLFWPAIAILMLRPPPFPLRSGSDLLIHFVLFAGLTVCVVMFVRSRMQLMTLVCLTMVISNSLEVAQRYVPHRSFELADMLANTAGCLTGGLLALVLLQAFVLRPGQSQEPISKS